MTDRLLRRLSAMDWPVPRQDRPDPAAGQLWRIDCDGTAGLAVIADAPAGRTVPAMAAIAEDVGDDRAVAAETENGMRVTVWTPLRTEIPTSALDHRVDDLTPKSFDAVQAVVSGRRQGDWAPISSILDDRVLIRLDLQEKMDLFDATTPYRSLSIHRPRNACSSSSR